MRRTRIVYIAGFTLLELLVTASIISMLAALLLPAIIQSRAATRRTVCLSNLRQWAIAVRMYAETYHGRLPYRGYGIQPVSTSMDLTRPADWFNALPPFIEDKSYAELTAQSKRPEAQSASVWVCPEFEPLDASTFQPQKIEPATFFAYGMNMALSAPFNGRPDHIEKVGPVQTMVFMADGLGAYTAVIPSKDKYSPIARHTGKTVNIAFLDGRVDSFVGDDIGCEIGDPKRPDIVWYPPNTAWPGPPK